MTGHEEHGQTAAARGPLETFPAEWGLPPGTRWSATRSRWVREHALRASRDPKAQFADALLRDSQRRHRELLDRLADPPN